MIYDHAFVRAIAQARVNRLIAEADAARTARALRASRPRRRWSARGWLRSRRRPAVAVPVIPSIPSVPSVRPFPSVPRPRTDGPH